MKEKVDEGRVKRAIDPRGRPTVTAVSVHCFRTYCPARSLENLAAQSKFQARETVGLAEWIIDGACLVLVVSKEIRKVQVQDTHIDF